MRAVVPVAAGIAAVTAASWHSVLISWHQWASTPLPGVALGAPLAVLIAAVVRPSPTITVTDRETDYIMAGIAVVLGGWILYYAPDRLGSDFLYLRPDFVGVAFLTLAVAALAGGTRFALWLAPSALLGAIVLMPGLQLAAVGFTPNVGLAALVAGVFSAVPLILARPVSAPAIPTRVAVAVAAAGAGGAASLVLHLSSATSSEVGSLLGVGALGLVCWRRRHRELTNRTVPGPFRLSAAVSGLVMVGVLALFDLIVPTSVLGASVVHAPLATAGERQGFYVTSNGLTVTTWSPVFRGGGENHSAMVIDTVGPSATAVDTFPISTVVSWSMPACPNSATDTIDGTSVLATAHLDPVNAYRWDSYQWLWPTKHGVERIAVVVASAPTGQPAPLPAARPDSRTNLVGTIGQLVADRHLICGPSPLPSSSLQGRLVRSIMAQSPAVR
jgi:hypothetical protein